MSTMLDLPETMTVFTVRTLSDPLIERHGFAVRSPYTEFLYLPILGPSATFALRRMSALAEVSPVGSSVDVAELAQSLGLGVGTGRTSAIMRTLRRLVTFDVARWDGSALLVRRAVAPLSLPRLRRLSPTLQRLHHRMLEDRRDTAA